MFRLFMESFGTVDELFDGRQRVVIAGFGVVSFALRQVYDPLDTLALLFMVAFVMWYTIYMSGDYKMRRWALFVPFLCFMSSTLSIMLLSIVPAWLTLLLLTFAYWRFIESPWLEKYQEMKAQGRIRNTNEVKTGLVPKDERVLKVVRD